MMTSDRHRRSHELFLAVLERPPDQRGPFLEKACSGDAELRAEVERLLARGETDTAEPLAPSPVNVMAMLEDGARSEVQTLEVRRNGEERIADRSPAAEWNASRLPSDQFPGYQLIREIHRGGQGVVYQAIQDATKRKVAIKVLLEGPYASEKARRRFEREIELVASLKHHNIISIFDSGHTSDGRQFCVMDYVRGVPLNQYVRDRKLALPDALQLFGTVCDAVNYAHQKGVIHRDLKPSNILVDADSNAKVLDFGLAKMVGGPEHTLISATGQVLGTLPYMSPEQTHGNSDEIDTRTDVYALGVILYEMLTGNYPYPVAGQMAEVLRHITETEPKPPSRNWGEVLGVSGRSSRRRQKADCPIDDEVETIVLKCLAKERHRRYQTAGELSRDISHYLAAEPIEAKRDSSWYLLRTALRRYKVATAVAAAFAVLISAWAVTLSVLHRTEQELHHQTAAQNAELRAARAREGDLLVERVYDRMIYDGYWNAGEVDGILGQARQMGADPRRLALVSAWAEIKAQKHQAAIQQLEPLLEEDPDNGELLYLLAWTLREIDDSDWRRRFEEAERLGTPATPSEWLFRGWALHRYDAAAAISSYESAIGAARKANRMFHQAELHLARAHNQLMWSERDIGSFHKSEDRLLGLISLGHYGAHPYYLLSIARRLAGEIRADSGNDDDRAAEYFDLALEAVRAGRLVDPDNERLFTAEAEALERMGLFEEAIAARSRAIEAADQPTLIYEGLHFRWRLYFWAGRGDAALADVRRIATEFADTASAERVYAHVYPAIIHAQSGQMDLAVDCLLSLIGQDEVSALDVIWAASGLRLLGLNEQADQVLSDSAERADYSAGLVQPQTEFWVRQLYAFCSGLSSADSLLRQAQNADAPRRLLGEVHFHAAAAALSKGERKQALSHLEDAYRSFDAAAGYHFHAQLLLQKMRTEPAWPTWIRAGGAGPARAARESMQDRDCKQRGV